MIQQQKLHVLLVDDSRAAVAHIQTYIERGGHRVTFVDSGEAAVEQYRAEPPDLVLMDVVMPGMGGIEATRRIKAMKLERWVPVMLMTALSGDQHLIDGLDAGADEFIFKPIHLDVLEARMRAMQRIASLQQTLADVLDNVVEGIVLIDTRGSMLSLNQAAEKMFGYHASELIGKNVNLLMPSPHREQHDRYISDYLTTRIPKVMGFKRRLEGMRKNGTCFPMRLGVSSVLTPEGEIFIGLVQDCSTEEALQSRIEHMAWHDQLTNLPNRANLYERVDALVSSGEPFSLLFIDLDGFKPINDRHGHRVGDEVLRIVGERMRNSLAKADMVARVGGDEFVVVARGTPPLLRGMAIASRLQHAISAPITVDDVRCSVSLSIGVALFPQDGKTGATLVSAADQAMYVAKKSGGARAQAFSAITAQGGTEPPLEEN